MSFISDMRGAAARKVAPARPSSDVAKGLEEKYGISLSGGGYGAEADDPPVVVGRLPAGMGLTSRTRTLPSSVLEKKLYQMNPAEVADLQRRLLSGGFFPGDVDEEDLTGVPDEDTLSAYRRAIGRAASFYDAGQELSLNEVIGSGVRPPSAGKKGRERAPQVTQLSNPLDLSRTVEAVARKVIGRKLSDDERAKFVSLYHQIEAQQSNSAYAMDASGGTIVNGPSVEAFAEREAEAADPHGAREMDLLSMNNTIMGFLKGGGDG